MRSDGILGCDLCCNLKLNDETYLSSNAPAQYGVVDNGQAFLV